MPLNYSSEIEAGYILIEGSGRLAVSEYVEINHLISADKACAGITRRLYDMREVDVHSTFEHQSSLHEQTRDSSGERMAIIVGSPSAFGMARMYQTLAYDVAVELFYEKDKALNWLLKT